MVQFLAIMLRVSLQISTCGGASLLGIPLTPYRCNRLASLETPTTARQKPCSCASWKSLLASDGAILLQDATCNGCLGAIPPRRLRPTPALPSLSALPEGGGSPLAGACKLPLLHATNCSPTPASPPPADARPSGNFWHFLSDAPKAPPHRCQSFPLCWNFLETKPTPRMAQPPCFSLRLVSLLNRRAPCRSAACLLHSSDLLAERMGLVPPSLRCAHSVLLCRFSWADILHAAPLAAISPCSSKSAAVRMGDAVLLAPSPGPHAMHAAASTWRPFLPSTLNSRTGDYCASTACHVFTFMWRVQLTVLQFMKLYCLPCVHVHELHN